MLKLNNIKISASILSMDMGVLSESAKTAYECGADEIHFDIMDGVFVPPITYGADTVKAVRKILPKAFFDVHLMVNEPSFIIKELIPTADSITIHIESNTDTLQNIKKIKSAGLRVGIAINPDTPIEKIFPVLPFLKENDMVLIMTVVPGYGGQSMREDALSKIQQIKNYTSAPLILQADGGINHQNLYKLYCLGIRNFAVGSAVFKNKFSKTEISEKLKALRYTEV